MPTFLERYNQGDRIQVWTDLTNLGPSVRDARYLNDAKAVARETMLRARHNIETLIPRLDQLGYKFRTRQNDAANSLRTLQQSMALFESLKANLAPNNPLASNPLMNATSKSLMDSILGSLKGKASAPPPSLSSIENPDIFSRPEKGIQRKITRVEKAIGGPIPLSLRAWCEEVGSVSLVGSHPALHLPEAQPGQPIRMMVGLPINSGPHAAMAQKAGIQLVGPNFEAEESPLGDPLEIQPDFDMLEDMMEEYGGPWEVELAADDLHKANVSGGDPYGVAVPNAAADAIFTDWHKTTFVNYLRIAFQWGGFPGWERYPHKPEKELAYLIDGLLPV